MRKRILAGVFCALLAALALPLGGNSTTVIASGSPPCDFLTGGGFIYPLWPVTIFKGTFAIAGGCKQGSGHGWPPGPFWGHLQYHDHGVNLKAHSISVTGYRIDTVVFPHPKARLICGKGKTHYNQPFDFVVRAKDAGEPGTNDEFDIQLTGGLTYSTFATGPHKLGGGNIQLHKPHHWHNGVFGGWCPTLPDPPGEEFTLTVFVLSEGNGTGTVTFLPPGFVCSSGTCMQSYTAGAPVLLTATPTVSNGSTAQITDPTHCDPETFGPIPTCTVMMDADKSVTVTFFGQE